MRLEFLPEPGPEEIKIRTLAKTFVDKHLRPFSILDDEECHFRRGAFDHLAKLGLHCLAMPKQFGGGGLPSFFQFACLEEIARGSASMAVTVGVHNLPQGALLAFANEAQRERFLSPLVRGEWLGAFSLSEPNAGSDAASLQCSARRKGNGYVLNGTKMWCSTAGYADLYLVMARTSEHKTHGISSFIVLKDTPGFRVGKHERKLGLHGSSLAELVFEDCFIPEQQLLSNEGDGLKIAFSQLDSGRITIGVAGAALSIEAIERAWAFLSSRAKQGGTFDEGVRHELAARFAQTQAVRNLAQLAAHQKDLGKKMTLLASQVKLLGSDLAMQTTSDVVQFMGPYGCMKEYEVERLMRDAKALQIVEGTNQIQKEVIGRELDRMVNS